MTHRATGTFEVQMTPQDAPGAADIGAMSLQKSWSGDLEGTGHGFFLSAGDPGQGVAGYVALETFAGTLGERAGSFALQQFGTMDGDDVILSYAVVPGSGDGELMGIRGNLELTITEGVHHYELDYSLPE